jgi:ribA/ribD-fused uncharacterized protein
MTYNMPWLLRQSPDPGNFLFFWGHQPAWDGTITKTCLSQWWVAPFVVDGVTYPTAEHWMMAGKARLFNDEEAFRKIIAADSPRNAKNEGRLVKNFDPDQWEENKFQLVVEGNFHKFSQHPALRQFLLDTGNKVLAEASPLDRIWGIGLASDNPAIQYPAKWNGENLLGFALMEVRDKM